MKRENMGRKFSLRVPHC